jgi:hypothetical protein
VFAENLPTIEDLRNACTTHAAGDARPQQPLVEASPCDLEPWISTAAAECVARATLLPDGVRPWDVVPRVSASGRPVWLVVAAVEATDREEQDATLQIDAITAEVGDARGGRLVRDFF